MTLHLCSVVLNSQKPAKKQKSVLAIVSTRNSSQTITLFREHPRPLELHSSSNVWAVSICIISPIWKQIKHINKRSDCAPLYKVRFHTPLQGEKKIVLVLIISFLIWSNLVSGSTYKLITGVHLIFLLPLQRDREKNKQMRCESDRCWIKLIWIEMSLARANLRHSRNN